MTSTSAEKFLAPLFAQSKIIFLGMTRCTKVKTREGKLRFVEKAAYWIQAKEPRQRFLQLTGLFPPAGMCWTFEKTKKQATICFNALLLQPYTDTPIYVFPARVRLWSTATEHDSQLTHQRVLTPASQVRSAATPTTESLQL